MVEAEAGVSAGRSAPRGSPVDGPWPSGASFGPRGLEIAGVAAADLASRHGTPLLVIDEDDFRVRCRAAVTAWPRAFFAIKAFTGHSAIRIAAEEGLDLLASTSGEVEACLRAGIAPARISMHGNNRSDEELDLAVRSRLGLVVLDNREDVFRLGPRASAAGIELDVLVRVIPEVSAETHRSIATGHETSRFGVPLADVVDVARAVDGAEGLRFVGIHAHLGSQILDVEPYLQEAETLVNVIERLRDQAGAAVELFDVGGGFGIAYLDERAPGIDEVAAQVREAVARACAIRDLPMPVVAAEPGRSLIGPAGITLYRVGTVKTAAGRRVVAVDGGMSDNPRPALYGARYSVAVASAPLAGPTSGATIAGKHCESGDVLADRVELPVALGRGDLLAFAATGAYTYPMASVYNRVGRPAVVAVRLGESRPWLRREDAADLDRLEVPAYRRPPELAVPDGVTIRPADPRDARAFLEFWRAIVAEERFVRSEEVRHPLRVYRRRFRRPWTDREAQIMAVEGDRVVGHIYVAREEHPVTAHVATLGLAVAADRRGRGIGAALLSEGLVWARRVGLEKVVLSVYPHNTAAIALYRKFGFVDEGRLAGHSRKSYGYEDEVMMATWLQGPR